MSDFFVDFLETSNISNKFLFALKNSYNFLNSFLVSNQKLFLNKLYFLEGIYNVEKLIFSQYSLGIYTFVKNEEKEASSNESRECKFVMINSFTKDVSFVDKEIEEFLSFFQPIFLFVWIIIIRFFVLVRLLIWSLIRLLVLIRAFLTEK